jgi:hypothetical protein
MRIAGIGERPLKLSKWLKNQESSSLTLVRWLEVQLDAIVQHGEGLVVALRTDTHKGDGGAERGV